MPEINQEWVVVRNCFWVQEALIVKSLLEAEGIDVLIPDEHFAGMQPHYGIAIGGVRVMVRSADSNYASAILNALHAVEGDSGDSSGDESD